MTARSARAGSTIQRPWLPGRSPTFHGGFWPLRPILPLMVSRKRSMIWKGIALLAIWIAPSSRGTEAAEAGAASQTVQIERQAGDKTGARLTIVCNVLGTAALAALLTGFWFANGYLSYMYQGGYLITAFISLCALACAVNNDSI